MNLVFATVLFNTFFPASGPFLITAISHLEFELKLFSDVNFLPFFLFTGVGDVFLRVDPSRFAEILSIRN